MSVLAVVVTVVSDVVLSVADAALNLELSEDETIAFGLISLVVITATIIDFQVEISDEIVFNDGTLTEHIPLAVENDSFWPAFDFEAVVVVEVWVCLSAVIVLAEVGSIDPSSAWGSVEVVVGL